MRILTVGGLSERHVDTLVRVKGYLSKQDKKGKGDKVFLHGKLVDETGTLFFNLFGNANDGTSLLSNVPDEAYVVIEGIVDTVTAGKGKNLKSLKSINTVTIVSPEMKDIDEKAIKERLIKRYNEIKDPKLKTLVSIMMRRSPDGTILANNARKKPFFMAPYSNQLFNYKGGLSLYTARVFDVVDTLLNTRDNPYKYDELNLDVDLDILYTAVFVHSIGSVSAFELSNEQAVFTDSGLLLNVDTLSISNVMDELSKVKVDKDVRERLLQIIAVSTIADNRWKNTYRKTLESSILNQAMRFVKEQEHLDTISRGSDTRTFITDGEGYQWCTPSVVEEND